MTLLPMLDRLRSSIGSSVIDAVGVPCRDVILVRPGSLPKTSSGKLQRVLCKQQYLAGSLELAG
jgi:fatty-acyl-CoA synthase